MPSAIGSFDRIATRLQRGATAKFENERSHREYVSERQREALEAKAKHQALEAHKTLLETSATALAEEIKKLASTNKLRIKQGFPAVYRQVTWMLPAELKFTEDSVGVAVEALRKALGEQAADLLPKWESEINTIGAEMKQRDVERKARLAQQEAEDKDYYERCIITIQEMFKSGNPDVKNFFKLLPYLREIVVAPRHRGLRGQQIIVEAIRFQMSGFAQRWHDQLERSLERSAEREQAWRERKAAENASKKRAMTPNKFNHVKQEAAVVATPVDRDVKWAEEAAAAADYHCPPYESESHTASLEEVVAMSNEAEAEAPVEVPAEDAESITA